MVRLASVLLGCILGVIGAGCASTGARDPDDMMTPQEMPADLNDAAAAKPASELDAEITAFLMRYADTYNREDYAALLAMWDRDDPNVFYLAEEIDPPMQGWPLIEAYFARPGVIDGVRNEYTRIRAHYLAPDLAIATYHLRFDIKIKNMEPLSGFDRVVGVFRRKNGEWKMAAYAEAPQAPLTMVRRFARNSKTLTPEQTKALLGTIKALQEEAVAPDFEAWLDTRPKSP